MIRSLSQPAGTIKPKPKTSFFSAQNDGQVSSKGDDQKFNCEKSEGPSFSSQIYTPTFKTQTSHHPTFVELEMLKMSYQRSMDNADMKNKKLKKEISRITEDMSRVIRFKTEMNDKLQKENEGLVLKSQRLQSANSLLDKSVRCLQAQLQEKSKTEGLDNFVRFAHS